jgi:hypothetical protein
MPGTFSFAMPVTNSWAQVQLDPTPKKVYGGTIELEIDGLSVREAAEVLSTLSIPDEAVETIVDLENNNDYASSAVTWYRLETLDEVQARIQRANQEQQRSIQRRREQYEALRQEFENEV